MMNIVLYFAMWIQQCVGQEYMYSMCTFGGPILWRHDVCQSMDRSYGSCTKDQSYGDTMHVTKNLMHVQSTNPMGQHM